VLREILTRRCLGWTGFSNWPWLTIGRREGYQQWRKVSGQSPGRLPLQHSVPQTFAPFPLSMDHIACLKWLEKQQCLIFWKDDCTGCLNVLRPL